MITFKEFIKESPALDIGIRVGKEFRKVSAPSFDKAPVLYIVKTNSKIGGRNFAKGDTLVVTASNRSTNHVDIQGTQSLKNVEFDKLVKSKIIRKKLIQVRF